MKNNSIYIMSFFVIFIVLLSAIMYRQTGQDNYSASNERQNDITQVISSNVSDIKSSSIENTVEINDEKMTAKSENAQTAIISLQQAIEDGKSIMFIQCHPDDSEIFMPGTFAMASGDEGNKCYICCVGRIENVPSIFNRTKRMEAIKWFTSKYLEDYIWLNNSTPFVWDQIKPQLITIINTIRPDIIITYSPFGYYGHPEHRNTSAAISAIYNSLSYKPKIYWIINTAQDIVRQPMPEQSMYPPTDIINLNVYSSKLGKTYWDAKLEIWEQYSYSVPDLKKLLADTTFFQNNNKGEYFRESGL